MKVDLNLLTWDKVDMRLILGGTVMGHQPGCLGRQSLAKRSQIMSKPPNKFSHLVLQSEKYAMILIIEIPLQTDKTYHCIGLY